MNSAEYAMQCLTTLGEEIVNSSKKHREDFKTQEIELLNHLRICVDGLMSALYLGINEPIQGVTPQIEYQLLAGASFIKTHLLLNDSILDGHLVEAYCLLRKQLELLARLEELETQSVEQVKKKTPNVKHALEGFGGRLYGELSEIAHFSTFEIGQALLEVEEKESHSEITIFSAYNQNSQDCMNLRLYLGLGFIKWLLKKLSEWYPDKKLSKNVEELFVICMKMSLSAGIMVDDSS